MVFVGDINLRKLTVMNGMVKVLRSVYFVRYLLSGMECYALVVIFGYRVGR